MARRPSLKKRRTELLMEIVHEIMDLVEGGKVESDLAEIINSTVDEVLANEGYDL